MSRSISWASERLTWIHGRYDHIVTIFLLGGALLVPLYAHVFDASYYETLATRVLILGAAAASLNLIMGYAGMVSFGHVMFIGLGAYSVGILSLSGISNGFVHLIAAVAISGIVAAGQGRLCKRVKGIAFIMITLAFSQMFFFLAIGLRSLGGDEGMPLASLSDFGGPLSFRNSTVLYYAAWLFLVITLYGSSRLVASPFGHIVIGTGINEPRLQMLGLSTFPFRLVWYVIAGIIGGVAGMLLANLNGFISPDFFVLALSGELLVMVVLGGMRTIMGPVVGAFLFLVAQDIVSGLTVHWMLYFGVGVVAFAVYFRQGVFGWLQATGQR